jgi:glycyl-tRNA synthetase beta subunit
MVMVEDEPIRNNRLALLDEIGQLFLRFADFSKLT